jgi:acyl carrier protein
MGIEDFLYSTLAESRRTSVADARSSVADGGAIDSLEGVELVAAAEGQYSIEIQDQELPQVCSSIPRLAALIAAKIERTS